MKLSKKNGFSNYDLLLVLTIIAIIGFALLGFLAYPAHAEDASTFLRDDRGKIVYESRPNLWGGHTLWSTDGEPVAEGRPSLTEDGETYESSGEQDENWQENYQGD